MTYADNHLAPKKAANLSINSKSLAEARSLKLSLSATLEHALADEVRKFERTQWLEKNREAMDASNRLVEEKGLFADSYRTI